MNNYERTKKDIIKILKSKDNNPFTLFSIMVHLETNQVYIGHIILKEFKEDNSIIYFDSKDLGDRYILNNILDLV